MALRAQELAPSGIMPVILSLEASIYSTAFKLLASKRVWSSTQNYLKVKYPPVTYLCSLFLQPYVHYHCPKSMEMTSSP